MAFPNFRPLILVFYMSWWIIPTTADVGIRSFSSSITGVIRETTLGMQSILLSEKGALASQNLVRKSGEWSVKLANSNDNTLVSWLEEVLYQGEVEGRWLVDCQLLLGEESLDAQVSYVDAEQVEREVEIKAVTRHNLNLSPVKAGDEILGISPDVPTFEGPGWVAQVIFDI